MLTAGLFMFATADGALAKNGNHSDDHGSMRSGDHDRGERHSDRHEETSRNTERNSSLRKVREDNGGDKHAEKHKDKAVEKKAEKQDKGNHEDKHAQKQKDKDAEKQAKQAETTKDKEPDKTAGTTTTANGNTPAAGSGKDLFDKGVVGKMPTDIKRIPLDPGKGDKPTETSGGLPPKDPVGNTHPTVNGGGSVTVSNGVTTYDIRNGPGGVAVYSGKDGTITVTNGTESKTLNGGSLTLSGNVVGVGAAQNIQVGARNGEGRTVVAIRPPAPAEAKPSAPGHVTTGPGSITVTGDDLKTAGKAVAASPFAGVVTGVALPVVSTAAAVGLVKDGASGAYKAASSAASSIGGFIKGGLGLGW